MSNVEKLDPSHFLSDKTILVTGGTGSFGHFITKELLKYNPSEIRIFSRDEDKQYRMEREFPQSNIKFMVGNVRDYERLLEATKDVDITYHAAALKQIPLCEVHPVETLKTNILGTYNVKRCAKRNRVEKTLLISTDKAVKPVNAYGMSKALAEKIFVNEEIMSESKFSVVRYGNVLGSRGSVIPLFKRLISEGNPLTITHLDMTRFFITLQQAIQLVFYATATMKKGEIFVPKIPACKIIDLAKAMSDENYPIKIIGIRSGEKIHECLISEDEFRRTEERGNYYIIHPYGEYASGMVREEFTSENARRLSVEEIAELLMESGQI